MFSNLPSAPSTSPERDEATFAIALDGVTRHGLFEAVRAILQGALGHAFFPNPPELRMQCDKAMEHHKSMRELIARRERVKRERPLPVPPLTAEQQARREEVMRRFHASVAADKEAGDAAMLAAERADIRARYGMTDEVMAGIADRPVDKNWKRTA